MGVLDKEFGKQTKTFHLELLGLQLSRNETLLQCVRFQLNLLKKPPNVAFVFLSCCQNRFFPKDLQRRKREVP